MLNPTLSIIVPVYKTELYLHRCVDSILAQTFTDFELILVDDGSPDNCGVICDEYAKKDTRVRVIHKVNGGLSSARNAGLNIITGVYIGFVDSDDYIEPDMYEQMYNICQNNVADICVCKSKLLRDGKIIEPITTDYISIYNHDDALIELFSETNFFVTSWDKLYHVSLWDDIRFPINRIHEDTFTSYRVFDKANKTCLVYKALYIYEIRSGSITNNKFTIKRFDNLDAFNEAMMYFQKKNVIIFDQILRTFYYKSLYLLNLICLDNKLNKKSNYFKIYRRYILDHYNDLMGCKKLCGDEKKIIKYIKQYNYIFFFWYKNKDIFEKLKIKRIINKLKRIFIGETK